MAAPPLALPSTALTRHDATEVAPWTWVRPRVHDRSRGLWARGWTARNPVDVWVRARRRRRSPRRAVATFAGHASGVKDRTAQVFGHGAIQRTRFNGRFLRRAAGAYRTGGGDGGDRGARPRRAIATAAEEDYSLRHTHASRDSTRVGDSGAPRRRGHTADEYQHQATVWSRVGLSCAAMCHPHIFELGSPYHRTPPPPPLSPPPAAAATDAALPLTLWLLPLPCLHRACRVCASLLADRRCETIC